jgi:beta-lactamase regulating signal transducer with metallopeptidase domain
MNGSLLPILLESAMRALIAAAAIWTGLRVFRVRNVPAQKSAWGLMLMAALAMPLVMHPSWIPAWASVKLPASLLSAKPSHAATAAVVSRTASQLDTLEAEMQEQVADEATSLQPAPPTPSAKPGAPSDYETENLPSSAAPIAEQPPIHPSPMLASLLTPESMLTAAWNLYLGVCAFLLVRLLWGMALSLTLWSRAKPVDTPRELDFPALIRVRSSSVIGSPVNIGSGILLPADFAEWDEEKLRVVLAHELSHIRQRDFYLQFLAGFYAALTWFSPLGWWLKRKLSDLGEAISDRAGLAAAKSPSAYAGLLLEFAALPRPTLNGVGMAHSRNLSHRIERILNEANFRLAFTGRRRALLTVLISFVLIVATAMVRVQAASAPQQASFSRAALPQSQAPSSAAVTGQSTPEPAQITDLSAGQAPAAAASPEPAPAPPMPAASPTPAPEASPAPAAPQAPEAGVQEPLPVMPPMPPMPRVHVDVNIPEFAFKAEMFDDAGRGRCFGDGDSYAIVGDPGTKTRFCGDWDGEGSSDVDKARSAAHGHFLLFRHEGKLYIVDDPATVTQLEAMDKARQDLSEQMRALSKQMRDAGQQARDAARDAARKARESADNLPAPDLSKEIAALDATAASLKDKQGGTVSRQQLQELQREIGELQRRVFQAEFGNMNMKEFSFDMSKFGEEQGKYGQQMGKLGAQMGQTMRENNDKIRSIIDESLKEGKARPVN